MRLRVPARIAAPCALLLAAIPAGAARPDPADAPLDPPVDLVARAIDALPEHGEGIGRLVLTEGATWDLGASGSGIDLRGSGMLASVAAFGEAWRDATLIPSRVHAVRPGLPLHGCSLDLHPRQRPGRRPPLLPTATALAVGASWALAILHLRRAPPRAAGPTPSIPGGPAPSVPGDDRQPRAGSRHARTGEKPA